MLIQHCHVIRPFVISWFSSGGCGGCGGLGVYPNGERWAKPKFRHSVSSSLIAGQDSYGEEDYREGGEGDKQYGKELGQNNKGVVNDVMEKKQELRSLL